MTSAALRNRNVTVFLGWSGVPSHVVATALHRLLRDLDAGFQPWMSSVDIAAGHGWRADVIAAIRAAKAGVICLSRDSQRSAWVQFEAGALSIAIPDSRICPYVIDAGGLELSGALEAFQACPSDRDGTWRVIVAINQAEPSLSAEATLLKRFQKLWPAYERVVVEAARQTAAVLEPGDYNCLDDEGLRHLLENHFLATIKRMQSLILEAMAAAADDVDDLDVRLLAVSAKDELDRGRLSLAPFYAKSIGWVKEFLDRQFPTDQLGPLLENGIDLAVKSKKTRDVLSLVERLTQTKQTALMHLIAQQRGALHRQSVQRG